MVISILKKVKLLYLTGLITLLLLIWEGMGSFSKKCNLLRYWGYLSKLNWIKALTRTIARTVSMKIETLISCLNFLCLEVAFYFFKSIIRPCMEHCFHVCAGASRCFIVEKYYTSCRNGYLGPLLFYLYL